MRPQSLTICAAAICKFGVDDGVVGISDRMLSVGEDYQFEFGRTKIFAFHPANVICLTAGDANTSLEIAREAYRLVEAQGITDVSGVADLFAQCHAALRRRQLEECLLVPLGLDLATFMSRQSEWRPEFVSDIVQRMQAESGDLGVDAIITGVDATGAHVYRVCDPGQFVCMDKSGFCAIGIGDRHFQTVFNSGRYNPGWGVPATMLLMFSAKKQAEMSPGVGRDTDMIIVGKNGAHSLLQDEVEAIGAYHDDLTQRIAQARDSIVRAMTWDYRVCKPVREPGPVAPAEPFSPPEPESPPSGSD